MTEARAKRRPGAGPVVWVSLLLFCVLLGFLTYRLSVGGDPSGVSASAAEPATRKVIVRRVVTTVVPAAGAPGPEAPVAAGAAPELAPAPEPEPAPVATSSS